MLTQTRTQTSRNVRDLVAEIEERAIRERIRQARKESGLTQRALAEVIQVEPRTYQNYEDPSDTGRTPWKLMNAIGKATGKTSEWLLHGDAPDLMGTLSGSDKRLARIEDKLDQLLGQVGGLEEANTRAREVVDEISRQLEGRTAGAKPGTTAPKRRGPRKKQAAS